MIETKYSTDVFEDAVHATAFIATVHVREGELMLPQRIREHIADGPVVVHLMRGQDDVAVHEATLTSRSTLTGIEWPDDVQPRMTLTVMCPRGAASHDVGVLLPNLEVPAHAVVEPEREPIADDDVEEMLAERADEVAARIAAGIRVWNVGDPEPEIGTTVRSAYERSFTRYQLGWQPGPWNWLGLLESQAPLVEVPRVAELPGPAEYTIPTDLPATGELELPTWPGDEDLVAGETTETFTAVLMPVAPDFDEAEPGTVFSAALVAVRTPPPPRRRAGWLERRLREVARLVLDHSWTATRIAVAAASGLVLAGAGLGYVVQLVVTR